MKHVSQADVVKVEHPVKKVKLEDPMGMPPPPLQWLLPPVQGHLSQWDLQREDDHGMAEKVCGYVQPTAMTIRKWCWLDMSGKFCAGSPQGRQTTELRNIASAQPVPSYADPFGRCG